METGRRGEGVKINQISLFLENEPGHLASICRVLGDAGINIVTLSLADTTQFGIVRLIVDDWRKAKRVLEESGRVVRVTEVVATQVDDRPGGLAIVLEMLAARGIDIEYMYAFTFKCGDRATLVFRFDRPDAAIDCLREGNIGALSEDELLRQAHGR